MEDPALHIKRKIGLKPSAQQSSPEHMALDSLAADPKIPLAINEVSWFRRCWYTSARAA
jgi:hypothetical protein